MLLSRNHKFKQLVRYLILSFSMLLIIQLIESIFFYYSELFLFDNIIEYQ